MALVFVVLYDWKVHEAGLFTQLALAYRENTAFTSVKLQERF